MRILGRIALFVLFPTVIVAIIFLAKISFSTALRIGEWGERSIAESTLVVANEKIERIEETISASDQHLFHALDPTTFDDACERWREAMITNKLVAGAAIIDDDQNLVSFFYKDNEPDKIAATWEQLTENVLPEVDKFDSLDQIKHVHRHFDGQYLLISHYTKQLYDKDYTTVIAYDNDAILTELFEELLSNAGADLMANVVDDHQRVLFGPRLDEAGPFMVVRRFPSSFYKWRLQLAPKSANILQARAEASKVSQVMLIPLAFGVIVFGLAVLYLAVVREKRINRLKSEFIANVSHELKTPLSLIRMFGELLSMQRKDGEDKTLRYQEIILRETDRLTSLIDNVLDFAKIERGKSAYDFKPMHIGEIVERASDIFIHRMNEKNIKLVYEADTELPLVCIDDHSITLVVINLVDNAIKYATGTELVGISLKNHGRYIHLDVYDNGEGIAPAHVKRIFERFYRVPTAHTRKQRGSGIGLSLVRHIADAHGGKVVVSSEPGVETRFSVRLPIV